MTLIPIEEIMKSGRKIMVDDTTVMQRYQWWEYQDVIVLTAKTEAELYQERRAPQDEEDGPPCPTSTP